MALRTTPTIGICLMFGIAAGIALARPGNTVEPGVTTPIAEVIPETAVQTQGDPDSPYLVDGATPPSTDVEPVAPVEISIESFAFSTSGPIAAGSSITVTNLDSADHTLTARDGEFDTGILAQGESVTIVVPDTPGTYEFFCEVHPSMTGELVIS